jgi:hypothetical protein
MYLTWRRILGDTPDFVGDLLCCVYLEQVRATAEVAAEVALGDLR